MTISKTGSNQGTPKGNPNTGTSGKPKIKPTGVSTSIPDLNETPPPEFVTTKRGQPIKTIQQQYPYGAMSGKKSNEVLSTNQSEEGYRAL